MIMILIVMIVKIQERQRRPGGYRLSRPPFSIRLVFACRRANSC